MEFALENVLLMPIGMLFAGFASLVGIGGGLLWAPYFILIRGFDPQQAVIYSFLLQCVGMASATFVNIRSKKIFWNLALRVIPFVLVGVFVGSFLNQRVAQPQVLQRILGIVCLVISIIFAFHAERYDESMQLDTSIRPPFKMRFITMGFGSLSGLLSIGVSDFLVPMFRGWLKIPMHYAIGTSLFLNACIALTGGSFNLFLSSQPLNMEMLQILVFGWIGVVIGGQLGTRLMHIIDEAKVKEIFIFVLLMMGIHLIYKSL